MKRNGFSEELILGILVNASAAAPYLDALIVALLIITMVPEISLFLPNVLK